MRLRIGIATSILSILGSLSCGSQRSALPEEFPPVRLGMTRAEVRAAVGGGEGEVAEENARLLRVTGRDRRVDEEVFLFYRDRLAAYTIRYPGAASRGVFQRQSRRFTMSFGEPFEQTDNGMVLISRWRAEEAGGRVLMSAFVEGRMESPLMVRVEDPSVVPRLIREMEADSL